MTHQNHRYGLKGTILTCLLLISACGATQTSEADTQSGRSNGADAEVVTEVPAETLAKTPTQAPKESSEGEKANASGTALSEEETGVADLREFVDEIAPTPEKEAEVLAPGSSSSSEAGSSETGTKQEASPSVDKTTDTPTADGQGIPSFMVALATGGLQTIDAQTGSTLDIAFEVDRDIAVSTVSAAFGDPTETIKNSACPAGPLEITTWPNGFSINTLNETFVGWYVRPTPDSQNLTTIAGVGIGTSLANVQEAYDVEILESSLGIEFNVGQMSGILSSDQPNGEITHLWAGVNCIFR